MPPTVAVARENPSVQARTQQWSLGVGACGVPVLGPRRRIELPLCAAFEAGAMHARGRGSAGTEVFGSNWVNHDINGPFKAVICSAEQWLDVFEDPRVHEPEAGFDPACSLPAPQ